MKNITKSEQKRLFLFSIIEFILYGVSHSKTNLHNKYMIYLNVWLIFWTRLPINSWSLWEEMTEMCAHISK